MQLGLIIIQFYIDQTRVINPVTGITLQAENLHLWEEGSRGEPIADHVDLRPNAGSIFSVTDPTCYVDGCFVWSSGRDNHVTWIIPTVTCNCKTIKITIHVHGCS